MHMALALVLILLALPARADSVEAIIVRACVDSGLFAQVGNSAKPLGPLPEGIVISRVDRDCADPAKIADKPQRVGVVLHILKSYQDGR